MRRDVGGAVRTATADRVAVGINRLCLLGTAMHDAYASPRDQLPTPSTGIFSPAHSFKIGASAVEDTQLERRVRMRDDAPRPHPRHSQ
jgi:hypothetical protein